MSEVIDTYIRDAISHRLIHCHKDRRFWYVYLGPQREEYILKPFTTLCAVSSAPEEDWKTRIAHNIPNIPEGTEVVFTGVLKNFYGVWLNVLYNGREYSVDSKHFRYVQGPTNEQLEWTREVD